MANKAPKSRESSNLDEALDPSKDYQATRQGLKNVPREAKKGTSSAKSTDTTPAYRSVLKQEEFDPTEHIESECEAFAEHVNNVLAGHESLQHERYIPVTGKTLIDKFKDGVLLGYVLAEIKPKHMPARQLVKHLDLSQIGKKHSKVIYEVTANHNLLIESCKKAGLVVVNVGSEDILKGTPHLVLGLLWQMIRAHLLSDVNIVSHPELIRLLNKGEGLDTLLGLPSDQVLLRWANYHLARGGREDLQIHNFTSDICDSSSYAALIHQIAPKKSTQEDMEEVLSMPCDAEGDETQLIAQKEARATRLLETAAKIGCRRFVTAKDIATGRARLNLAFVATLFNHYIGIQLPSEEEIAEIFSQLDVLQEKVAKLRENLEEKDKSHALSLSQQSLKFESDMADMSEKHRDALQNARQETQEAIQIWTSKRNALAKQHQEFCQDLKTAMVLSAEMAKKYDDTKLQLSAWPPKGDKSLERLTTEAQTLALDETKAVADSPQSEGFWQPPPPTSPPPKDVVEGAPAGINRSNSVDLSHASPVNPDLALTRDELDKASDLPLAALPAAIKAIMMRLIEENNELRHRVHVTESIMAQKNKLNDLMGDKIREYTEDMISAKKSKSKKK